MVSLCAPSPQLQISPKHWHQPKKLFLQPHPKHIVTTRLQLRTERRKRSNFEALGISKPRAEIQNKCSFMWWPPRPTPFFPFCSFVISCRPLQDTLLHPSRTSSISGAAVTQGGGTGVWGVGNANAASQLLSRTGWTLGILGNKVG